MEKKKLGTVFVGCAGRTRGTVSIHADGIAESSLIVLSANRKNVGKFTDGKNHRIFINSFDGEHDVVVVGTDGYSIRFPYGEPLVWYSSSSALVEYSIFVAEVGFIYEKVSYKNRNGSTFYRVGINSDGAFVENVTEELALKQQESI